MKDKDFQKLSYREATKKKSKSIKCGLNKVSKNFTS